MEALFAVFDGHGGSQVSHIASKEFPKAGNAGTCFHVLCSHGMKMHEHVSCFVDLCLFANASFPSVQVLQVCANKLRDAGSRRSEKEVTTRVGGTTDLSTRSRMRD